MADDGEEADLGERLADLFRGGERRGSITGQVAGEVDDRQAATCLH